MNQSIKALKAVVTFFEGLNVVGYKMPDGSFRVGLAGASRVLGYGRGWLGTVVKGEDGSPETLSSLKETGFSNETIRVTGSFTPDRTISLDDFLCCIIYGSGQKRKSAVALNRCFLKLALEDFFRHAFGDPQLTIEEKRKLFYETYASSISPDDWREMDRQDIVNLALYGDEPHLRDGLWNDPIIGEV